MHSAYIDTCAIFLSPFLFRLTPRKTRCFGGVLPRGTESGHFGFSGRAPHAYGVCLSQRPRRRAEMFKLRLKEGFHHETRGGHEGGHWTWIVWSISDIRVGSAHQMMGLPRAEIAETRRGFKLRSNRFVGWAPPTDWVYLSQRRRDAETQRCPNFV